MRWRTNRPYRFFKRLLDVAVSASCLLLLSPVVILVAVVVRVFLGAPMLFQQGRSGLNGTTFRILKFRTMLHAVSSNGAPLPDEQRLTALGSFLRSWSLDELPQLWNVFKGDMSLVGPRPLLPHYLDLYTAQQRRRLLVKPGVTGLVQIQGRNSLSWERKFELDQTYVDQCSFWYDLRILCSTPMALLTREGISQANHATMETFGGARLIRDSSKDLSADS